MEVLTMEELSKLANELAESPAIGKQRVNEVLVNTNMQIESEGLIPESEEDLNRFRELMTEGLLYLKEAEQRILAHEKKF